MVDRRPTHAFCILTESWPIIALTTALLATGCQDRPSRIGQASIDPDRAGSRAMEEYDTDGDGFVADAELEAAPGLKAALGNLDTNSDGKVSAEEVAARVRAWQGQRAGMTGVLCQLFLDGRPLAGATVTFEPESFLGDQIETAVGTASSGGTVSPVIPKENRPTPTTPPGLRPGLYQVRVSKLVGGKETIPARYNSQTILGQEVAKDDPRILANSVVFKMKSK